MYTGVVFNEDKAAANATFDKIAGADDDHVTVNGDDIYVPRMTGIVGVYFAHGTAAAAGDFNGGRLTSPSILRRGGYYVGIGHDTNTLLTNGLVRLHPQSPLMLEQTEALNAEIMNGALAVARGFCLVLLSDGRIEPARGEIFTIKFTTAFTPTVNVWTSGNISLDTDLPAGRYQLVGAKVFSAATAGAFRFIFRGYDWRPAGVITTDYMADDAPLQRFGGMGVWGEFTHRELPRLEMNEVAAVANPTGFVDLIKVG